MLKLIMPFLFKKELMIKIAIVEDEKVVQDRLLEYLDKLQQEKNVVIESNVFSNGESFLFDFEYDKYDIVFMDIDLGKEKLNGVQTAKKMREKDKDVILVFITNLVQYAIDGYTVAASDFILKPISYFDFSLKISSFIELCLSTKKENIVIKCDGEKIILNVNDIYYVEINNHTLLFHTINGVYSSYGSLTNVAKELEKHYFSLCNSCYLINLKYVKSISSSDVLVHDEKLLISRSKRKQFLMDVNEFLGI